MKAAEFFRDIVEANYNEARANPNDLRLLINAILSMNTIAEFVALDRIDYTSVDRKQLNEKANDIRNASPALKNLKICAETLKHVRKLPQKSNDDFSLIPSSTGLSSYQPSTWVIKSPQMDYDLRGVLDNAFETIKQFPEFSV
jgi:hypothetical protein